MGLYQAPGRVTPGALYVVRLEALAFRPAEAAAPHRFGCDAMGTHAESIASGIARRLVSLGLAAAVALAGCTASELPRLPRTEADLIAARQADEAQAIAFRRDVARRGVARVKAKIGRAACRERV